GLVIPVFAFFAAGVPVGGEALRAIFTDRISIGIMVGLVVGKFIGIFGSSLLAVKLRLGDRPAGVGWTDLASLALLGGIGFTVSLLIAELSLTGDAAERAKAAVLIASALASVLGALVLVVRRRLARANSNGTAN
ncbi:MAG: Na+/H+ antiporter NhaA, partial [Saccharopolyspora rectivirgula]